MSKAEELLNSLVEAYVAESDPSSDSHIVIGVDRFITVPDELRRIAVQYDHNMRTVTFDCPRYYDGRDMSKMKVYINIRGPKGARYSYIADNVRVDTSNPIVMHFDWTIRRPITDVNGKLIFLVCIRKANDEGNEENHWNSELNTDLYISEGMEYEEFEEYPYSDIVTQLLQRMDEVEGLATPEAMQGYTNAWLEENSDTVLAEVQAKGNEVLASIPEEYTETYNYANEAARTKADAIIRTVEGESIAVSDSSDDYLRGLRVFGKTTQVQTTGAQLLNFPDTEFEQLGVKWVSKNGVVTAVGVCESSSVSTGNVISQRLTGMVGTYFISGNSDSVMVYVRINKAGVDTWHNNTSFTLDGTENDVQVYLQANGVGNAVDDVLYPMLNFGDAALPWEPYTGGVKTPNPAYPQELVSIENPAIAVHGKNLLKPRGFSAYGYTVVVNEDGSITVTGAANTAETIYLMITPYSDVYPLMLHTGVDYFMWSESSNGKSIGTKSIDLHGNPVWSNVETWNTNVPHKCNRIIQVYIESKNHAVGDTSLCGTYRIQLEVGNAFTGFEGYKERIEMPIQHTLPGIPVTHGGNYTDANGRQWVCDEVDFERGVYVKRIGIHNIVDYTDGCIHSDNTMYSDTVLRFDFGYKLGSRQQTPVLCNRFVNKFAHGDNVAVLRATELISSHSVNDVISVFIDKTRLATPDLAGFEEWLNANPTIVHCVLDKPIEIPLSAEELAAFRAIRSNYPNTTVLNDSNVKMEFKYNADTQLYIDNKIAEAVAALANKA